jgi:hypothetical protein
VYDYVAGKVDWSAFGLPIEGARAAVPAVRDARRDVAVCRPDERIGDVAGRLDAGRVCAVVNEAGVVLGKLSKRAWESPPEMAAEEAMAAGPSTYRPDVPLEDLLKQLDEHNVDDTLVTTQEGTLLGAVYRDDARRILAARGR